MLDEHGEAVAYEDEYDHWLVVSNTCDHERSETIEVVPLLLVLATPAMLGQWGRSGAIRSICRCLVFRG
ncbi:MAG: hypothetical protein KIT84_09505 [Labilithrix sp.]|nr:hypothetical protein [Labilithrix sp.]MCW5811236.1 hypothetical protein [Labilithrix sp.]